MRFKQRMSVLLPQPEGPIMAVTWCAATSSDTVSRACRSPYQALSARASRWGPRSASSGAVYSTTRSVRETTHPPPDDPARQTAQTGNECDQDERGAPRLRVPIGVWRARVLIDLDRQRGHRLQQVQVEELIAKRGQQQRRGFTAGARHRQHHTGN